MAVLTVSGIEMSVEKKKIKNMYIRVLPPNGLVQIIVPLSTTEDAIRMFAVSRIAWIKKQRTKFNEQPRQSERQYVSGESYYVWGQRYRLELVNSNVRNNVALRGQRIVMQVRKDSTPAQRASVMDEWYRIQIKEAISSVFNKCEKIVGVQATEWQVKNMRTKWGSCNASKRRIWLNLQLAKKTPECLEYVIIHELVHLLEHHHNDTFRAYMDKFCPNWRTIKESLNEQKLDYMEE